MQKITCCATWSCSMDSGGTELLLTQKCTLQKKVCFWKDRGKEKVIWSAFGDCYVAQHLGMPLHKQQGGVFCLTRDLFPPRTPSASSKFSLGTAVSPETKRECLESVCHAGKLTQPQAREWMRLFHLAILAVGLWEGFGKLIGRWNRGPREAFFYSLTLSLTEQQMLRNLWSTVWFSCLPHEAS